MAEEAIRDSGKKVTVGYDAKFGYPRAIYTDSRWSVTDSWLRIRIEALRPVAPRSSGVAPPT
jgi:hypothetical protein